MATDAFRSAWEVAQVTTYVSEVFGRVKRASDSNVDKAEDRDVVLVAAWRRPEFLIMSLSYVLAATHADEHEYVFILDYGYDPLVLAVATAFPAKHTRIHFSPKHEFIGGNSFNTLEGYRYAHMVAKMLGSKLVYLIEEDVWVARDYFTFHRAAHANSHRNVAGLPAADAEKIFQVTAFSIALNDGEFGEDRGAAVTACSANTPAGELLRSAVVVRRHYTSVALSFDTASLDSVVRHATKRYYEGPVEYITAEWGEQGFAADEFYGVMRATDYTEQDGLLNRDTRSHQWWTLSPRCPRAFHAGFTGYNRRAKADDSGGSDRHVDFYTRFEELVEMSPSQMVSAAKEHCPECHDVVPVPLNGYYSATLNFCRRFSAAGCSDEGWPPEALGSISEAAAPLLSAQPGEGHNSELHQELLAARRHLSNASIWLRSFHAPSENECCTACVADRHCKAWVFDDSWCQLSSDASAASGVAWTGTVKDAAPLYPPGAHRPTTLACSVCPGIPVPTQARLKQYQAAQQKWQQARAAGGWDGGRQLVVAVPTVARGSGQRHHKGGSDGGLTYLNRTVSALLRESAALLAPTTGACEYNRPYAHHICR